jgi:hypothetical protein
VSGPIVHADVDELTTVEGLVMSSIVCENDPVFGNSLRMVASPGLPLPLGRNGATVIVVGFMPNASTVGLAGAPADRHTASEVGSSSRSPLRGRAKNGTESRSVHVQGSPSRSAGRSATGR